MRAVELDLREVRRLHSLTDGLALARLLAVCLLFAMALLAVFRAPLSLLWRPAVVATELGHLLALLALLLALPGWTPVRGQLETALAIVAALLLLSPVVRAALVAGELPTRLAQAFAESRVRSLPEALAGRRPLRLGRLFSFTSPSVPVTRLEFGEGQGTTLQLDLYRRDVSMDPLPMVIVIHGGSWNKGDSLQLPAINKYLAVRGYAVAAINYRLAPEHTFPAAKEDVLAAIAFLEQNADQLGLDATRMVLLGRSAGGHLALLAAYAHNNPAIRGVVAYYPISDPGWYHKHPANPLVYDSRASLEGFLGGTPQDTPGRYQDASPYLFVDEKSPPTLLIHGARDELVPVSQTRRLDRRLADAGVPHLTLELPWATHGLDATLAGPGGQLSTYAIERFMATVMQ